MFKKYSEIMYDGGFEHPITITFPANDFSMKLTGEGGNRHLVLYDGNGSVDLWVDTHCDEKEAYIHSIHIEGNPSARFLYYIMSMLQDYTFRLEHHFWWFTLDRLDRMFQDMYNDMLHGYISH